MEILFLKGGDGKKRGMFQKEGMANFFCDSSENLKFFACGSLAFTHLLVFLYSTQHVYLFLYTVGQVSSYLGILRGKNYLKSGREKITGKGGGEWNFFEKGPPKKGGITQKGGNRFHFRTVSIYFVLLKVLSLTDCLGKKEKQGTA